MVDFIYRNKFPIGIVLALHYGVFMWSYYTDVPALGNPQITEIEIQVLEEEDIEELLKTIQPENLPEPFREIEVTNQVANENAEQSTVARDRGMSDAELSEQVYNELKQFEADAFARLAEGRPEQTEQDLGAEGQNPNPTNNDAAVEAEYTTNAVEGEVTVKFNLVGRYESSLPIPAYLCLGSGKVVIDIKVNTKGKVVSAKFNEGLSSVSRQCLIDQAVEKAKRSVFNRDMTASNPQSGTITYTFIAQ